MALSIVRTVADLRTQIRQWRAAGETIGFVPTMGALHAGHLSLVALSRVHTTKTVASIFVNPTQFAAHEDLATYPRGEAADAAQLERAHCDLLFAPDAREMYPEGFATSVTVSGVSGPLEGAFRPHFFGGVALVVAKLLNQVGPDVAMFGEKDWQQLAVVRRMVTDLDLPVRIVGGPTLREEDGLAMSSRNAYLSPPERVIAGQLNGIMLGAAAAVARGDDPAAVCAAASQALLAAGFASVDYVAAADADSLGPYVAGRPGRLLVAAWLGRTRLIDNCGI